MNAATVGRPRLRNVFPYREDHRFNEYIHRCGLLICKISGGGELDDEDRIFLDYAVKCYPPTKHDAAMEFQVRNVLKLDEVVRKQKEAAV